MRHRLSHHLPWVPGYGVRAVPRSSVSHAHERGAREDAYPGTLCRTLIVNCIRVIAIFPACATPAHAGDFADVVISYIPAPGQFINNTNYNDPTRALGAPIGGGTINPDNTKLVSLGGFGGSITLRFSPPVLDDPANPLGLDAIIFGNATWVAGNPNRRFAEAGVIEISADTNNNGLADDPWYVIPGSHLALPPANSQQSQLWDSNSGTSTPPANTAWYPAPSFFPNWPASYITTTFRLPALFEAQVVVNPNGLSATAEGFFNSADCTPTLILGDTNADNTIDSPSLTAGEFYTFPDNPYIVGITPTSGGGDAFDIASAVDPATGLPARLESFDFLRISTATNFIAGPLGELSTEIGAASRVRPKPLMFDITSDGITDAEDLYRWHTLGGGTDFTGEGQVSDADGAMLQRCIRRGERTDIGANR